jgi:hypothetical protein
MDAQEVLMSFRSVARLVPVLLVSSLITACPEAREPVIQVQANAIAKTQFDGEWYFQRTVVDTPYETEFTFIGDQGELERIRWRIEENLLIALRSYERIEGSDPDRNPDGEYEGSPVAAWPISSHFDIRRDYNPTTGEEGNVLVENSSDRLWHEREYVRVDWTTNVITNWNFYAQEAVALEPMNYAITDSTAGNAPIVSADYLEITSAFLAEPMSAVDPNFPEDGSIPLCWYFYHFDDCTAAEVVVRNSFMKIEDRDYEAIRWSGTDMELFGYFDVQRWSYDENYETTNTGRRRYQGTWNLWTDTHDGRACEAPEDGATDSCSDVIGSHCDALEGECTTPFRDRGLRTIPFHVSPDLDERLYAVVEDVVGQWNVPFRDTVNGLRYWECVDAGGSDEECTAADVEDLQVVVLCHNPVASGDSASCGSVGTSPRLGDLRYNLIWSAPQPGRGNPFGFGPAQLDPLTGEVVSAAAIIYEAPIRSFAARSRDIIQLINGEIDEDDFVEGNHVADWVAERNAERLGKTPLTPDEVADLAGDVRLRHHDAIPRYDGMERTSAGAARAKRQVQELMSDFAPTDGARDRSRERLDALIGTPIESMLVDDEAILLAGRQPGDAINEAAIDAASPLRAVRDQRRRVASKKRMERNAKRCVYHREFVDPSVQGYAADFAGVDPEEIRWSIIEGVFKGTVAHEMGHTFGLRHNLKGSADPLNYGPEYWDLRDDGNMEVRYLDPESPEEIAASIRQYQTSSVMDYLSRFNSDFTGVQSYDRAAIKYGYGRLMEVFYGDETADAEGCRINDLYQSQLWGESVPMLYDCDTGEPRPFHYTELLDTVGSLDDRLDVPQRLLSDEWGISDFWGSSHDYMVWNDDGFFWWPVVPYKFCSDEFVGSDIDCLYFDEGADLYEIPLDLTERYERNYILHNFARDAQFFNGDGHTWWIWDSFFDPMINFNQWWVLDAQFNVSFLSEEDYSAFYDSDSGYRVLTMGARETYNAFARNLARPIPGSYAQTTDAEGNETWEESFSDSAIDLIGLSQGRFLSTAWDFDQGYFWDDAIQRLGFMGEKILALEALFDPTTYFLGQDQSSDLRRYRVNYSLNFGPQLEDLVGSLITGDQGAFAPYAVDDTVSFPDYAALERALPVGAVPINPAADFTLQLHTMVLALALLPDTFDSGLINSMRIWLDGGVAEIETTRDVVSHNDPDAGLTWEAASYVEGVGHDAVETGIAARMIGRANRLVDLQDANEATIATLDPTNDAAQIASLETDNASLGLELDLHRENLNVLRAIHLELGTLDF